MRNSRLSAIVVALLLVAPACDDTTSDSSDVGSVSQDGSSASDVPLAPDASSLGILFDHSEMPVTINDGFHLGTTVPILTTHLWSREGGCEEIHGGTLFTEVAELSVFVEGMAGVAPVAGTYPIPRQLDPRMIMLEANSAAIQGQAGPVGGRRAESGVVVIEASEVTFTVDAVLDDGTPLRGRMTVRSDCR
jgi:hypothetical protein